MVLLSAAVGALALVLLRKAAQDEPDRPVVLLWHRPVWWVGVLAMGVEFLLQVAALASGPVSAVQVLVVMELPFCLVLSRVVLGGRLGPWEWTAITAMTVGVVVLLVALAPHGGHSDSLAPWTWSLGLTVTVAAIVAALVAARWTGRAARAVLAGVAAGMTAGLVAVLVKPVTSVVGRGLAAVGGDVAVVGRGRGERRGVPVAAERVAGGAVGGGAAGDHVGQSAAGRGVGCGRVPRAGADRLVAAGRRPGRGAAGGWRRAAVPLTTAGGSAGSATSLAIGPNADYEWEIG